MEQTSSTAYPNVLVLEYLRKTGQAGSKQNQAAKKATELVQQGYQQLVRFQKETGGFNWWGDSQPTNVILTGLGLQEFTHMAGVIDVDGRIARKARQHLISTQRADGSWPANSQLHGFNMQLGASDSVATAYIAWSLLEAGERGPVVEKAFSYLNAHLAAASEDAYTLALFANALALYDAKSDVTAKALKELAGRAQVTDKGASIPSKVKTVTYSSDEAATVETTALTASAFIISGIYVPLTSKLLQYLLASKMADGSFGSTQATILSLRALILAAGGAKQEGTASVAFKLNGKDAGSVKVTPDNSDVTQLVDMKTLTRPGHNHLEVTVDGKSAAQLQIVERHYLPWPKRIEPTDQPLALDVRFDKDHAKVGDRIGVSVEVYYSGDSPTFMVTAELGLPPGMTLDGTQLDALVASGEISRWREQGGRLQVFFNVVTPGSNHRVRFGVIPRMPMKGVVPDSVVYEYYTPTHRAVAVPTAIEVG
jgi:alpha-2-macroglobulin-like protein